MSQLRFERYPPKDAWRDPNKARRFYLNQLAAWGYKLSDVERILTDDAWMRSSLRTTSGCARSEPKKDPEEQEAQDRSMPQIMVQNIAEPADDPGSASERTALFRGLMKVWPCGRT